MVSTLRAASSIDTRSEQSVSSLGWTSWSARRKCRLLLQCARGRPPKNLSLQALVHLHPDSKFRPSLNPKSTDYASYCPPIARPLTAGPLVSSAVSYTHLRAHETG